MIYPRVIPQTHAHVSRIGVARACLFFAGNQESVREADTDNDGLVTFGELASLMHKLKKDPSSNSAFVRKIHKAPAQVRKGERGIVL